MGQTAAVLRLLLKHTICIIGLSFIINLSVVKIGNVFLWNITVYLHQQRDLYVFILHCL